MNIINEIKSMSKSQKRQLKARLKSLASNIVVQITLLSALMYLALMMMENIK